MLLAPASVGQLNSIGRTAALDSVKRLVEEGILVKYGSGKATFYTKKEVDEWFASE